MSEADTCHKPADAIAGCMQALAGKTMLLVLPSGKAEGGRNGCR
jgi:hypothetical protein